ncbi:hypothetical protein HOO54_04600 [Bacillus sp. WMMC1349]|uniref:Imm50 family immunity protein n=1 Tax=Bacillus sp. WMMC1349 TaxID=2736254 RepID=UPI00155544B9|nr:Imm50 family immunity protein [Bacillus sp. WMMC1349]NPC91543.1 hypothetical protein [Bacillus sp. WMMC1349]
MINIAKLMNPQAIMNLFGHMPHFIDSHLMDVELKRDGPCIFIRLMTRETVENKPKRWDEWDVVYIDISFIGVRDLVIKGLGINNMISQFEITERLKMTCSNQMQIECQFDWARIEKITPGLIGSV